MFSGLNGLVGKLITVSSLLKNKPIYFSERDKKDYNYFEDLSDGLFTDWMEPCVRWYVKDIWNFTKLSSWYFITTEENEEGYIHLHGILAIKNIMDYILEN